MFFTAPCQPLLLTCVVFSVDCDVTSVDCDVTSVDCDVFSPFSLTQLGDAAVDSEWLPEQSKRMLDSVGSSLLKKRWRTTETEGRHPAAAAKRMLDRVGSSLIRKRMLDSVGSSLLKRRMPQVKGSLLKKRMLDSIGSALLKRDDVTSTRNDVALNKRLLDSVGSSLLLKRQQGWNDYNTDDLWSKRIWHTSSLDRVGSSLLKRSDNADDNNSPADNGQWPRQLDEIMDGAIGRDTSTTLNHVKDA